MYKFKPCLHFFELSSPEQQCQNDKSLVLIPSITSSKLLALFQKSIIFNMRNSLIHVTPGLFGTAVCLILTQVHLIRLYIQQMAQRLIVATLGVECLNSFVSYTYCTYLLKKNGTETKTVISLFLFFSRKRLRDFEFDQKTIHVRNKKKCFVSRILPRGLSRLRFLNISSWSQPCWSRFYCVCV